MATFHANLVQSFKNFKDKYIGNTSIADIGDGTLTSAVSQIKSDLSDLIVFESITFPSVTLAGSSYSTFSVTPTKAGYKLLAVSGIQIYSTGNAIAVTGYYLTDNETKVMISVRNLAGISITSEGQILQLLWIKE